MPRSAATSRDSFEPNQGGRGVALDAVDVGMTLCGFLSAVTVTQVYRNLETVPIQASYTFPLPIDAVVLRVTMTLNGQQHRAVVRSKDEAAQGYKGALGEGNAAARLSNPKPGLYTATVGCLLPGERAELCVHYAQLHVVQRGRVTLRLPTTVAPHYNAAVTAGLPRQSARTYTRAPGPKLTLRVIVKGDLANAQVRCTTHDVVVHLSDALLELSLAAGSVEMDRDVVVTAQMPPALCGVGWWARSDGGVVALATFVTHEKEPPAPAPRRLVLLVDCSASMAGEGIVQAKVAVLRALLCLRPVDHFEIVLFGSDAEALLGGVVPATHDNVAAAMARTLSIAADKGSSELANALDLAWATKFPDGDVDILLITDGAVWDCAALRTRAATTNCRIFAVAVGCAPAEAMVRGLADVTSGACELVTPHEDMAERITAHFSRLDQPREQAWHISWPGDAMIEEVETGQRFLGETRHVFAWFDRAQDGIATLYARSGSQRSCFEAPIRCAEISSRALVRLAAAARVRNANDAAEARRLAIKHQLVTEHTSSVLVHERTAGQGCHETSEVRRVPLTLPAGWSAVDSIDDGSVATGGDRAGFDSEGS